MKSALLESLVVLQEVQKRAPRDGFGAGLLRAAEENPNIVAVCADLFESTRVEGFLARFPHRFVEVGVAEQNMLGVAAGLASVGKIPFAVSYAVFSPGRNWDQLRVSVCYSNLNVKIASTHAGLNVGADGATHQALEDIAITRTLPNLVIVAPCDALEAQKATLAAAAHSGPVYLRFARDATPVVTTAKTPFRIGKAVEFRQGGDVTVLSCGSLIFEALVAAEALAPKIKVQVINCPTVKPLDHTTILSAVRQTRAAVTVEEHQRMGGFGSAVAELLATADPVPMEMVGVADTFGESGNTAQLQHRYKLDHNAIREAIIKVSRRKR